MKRFFINVYRSYGSVGIVSPHKVVARNYVQAQALVLAEMLGAEQFDGEEGSFFPLDLREKGILDKLLLQIGEMQMVLMKVENVEDTTSDTSKVLICSKNRLRSSSCDESAISEFVPLTTRERAKLSAERASNALKKYFSGR